MINEDLVRQYFYKMIEVARTHNNQISMENTGYSKLYRMLGMESYDPAKGNLCPDCFGEGRIRRVFEKYQPCPTCQNTPVSIEEIEAAIADGVTYFRIDIVSQLLLAVKKKGDEQE